VSGILDERFVSRRQSGAGDLVPDLQPVVRLKLDALYEAGDAVICDPPDYCRRSAESGQRTGVRLVRSGSPRIRIPVDLSLLIACQVVSRSGSPVVLARRTRLDEL